MELTPADPARFQRWLSEAIVLPLVMGLALAVLSFWTVHELSDAFRWLDHTDQVIAQATKVERLMIDSETGIRGYTLSHDQGFLEPYRAALARLPAEFEALRALVADNASQSQRAAAMGESADLWLELAQRPRSVAYTAHAKRMMDELRKRFDEFIAVEQGLRDVRSRAVQNATHLVMTLGAGIALLTGVLLALRGRRLLLLLSRSYRNVIQELHDRASELFQSREWFATTLRSIGDAVIVVDTNSRVSFLNPVAERLTGWRSSEALARPMSEVFNIVHQETRQPAYNPVERVMREGVVVGLANHTTLIARDGAEYPIEDSAAPIRNDGTMFGVVLVFRDVVAKHQAEREMRALNERLQAAVRARDSFLSIASHELKTPLTSLMLQLELLDHSIREKAPEAPSTAKVAKTVALSLSQSQRIASLVDDLLDVSRVQAGKLSYHFDQVDLVEIASKALATLAQQLKTAGCAVALDARSPVLVRGDRFRLDQVILNLLTNALKYAPGFPVKVQIGVDGDSAVVKVTDRGPGIPPGKRGLIFERFERVVDSTAISGLGLGLYIARQIVDAHGGTLEVECPPAGGSTFVVRLPRGEGNA